MTDFHQVRRTAKRKGPLGDSTAPIPILPTNVYTVTRLVTIPLRDSQGHKCLGYYVKHPANIKVLAWSGAQASARADGVQINFMTKEWGNGAKPWDGESKMNWIEVPVPFDKKPLELQ